MSLISQKAEVLRTMRKNPKRRVGPRDIDQRAKDLAVLAFAMNVSHLQDYSIKGRLEFQRLCKLLGSIYEFGYTVDEFLGMVANLCFKQTFGEEAS